MARLAVIIARETPISKGQADELRAWMALPGAEVYRSVLAANIAARQAEAGGALIDAREHGNQMGDAANELADEARALLNALAIFEEFRIDDKRLIQLEITVDNPTVKHTEPEPPT